MTSRTGHPCAPQRCKQTRDSENGNEDNVLTFKVRVKDGFESLDLVELILLAFFRIHCERKKKKEKEREQMLCRSILV